LEINPLKMLLPRHPSVLPERTVESRRGRIRIADEKTGTAAQITNLLETSGGMIDRGAVVETGDCLEKIDAVAGKQLKMTNYWARTAIGKEKIPMLWQVTTMKPPPVAETGLETIDAKVVRVPMEEEKTTTDRHRQLHDGVVGDILISTIDRRKATENVVATILPAPEGTAMPERAVLLTAKRKPGASQGNVGVELLQKTLERSNTTKDKVLRPLNLTQQKTNIPRLPMLRPIQRI
jgi:hypothetical protein